MSAVILNCRLPTLARHLGNFPGRERLRSTVAEIADEPVDRCRGRSCPQLGTAVRLEIDNDFIAGLDPEMPKHLLAERDLSLCIGSPSW